MPPKRKAADASADAPAPAKATRASTRLKSGAGSEQEPAAAPAKTAPAKKAPAKAKKTEVKQDAEEFEADSPPPAKKAKTTKAPAKPRKEAAPKAAKPNTEPHFIEHLKQRQPPHPKPQVTSPEAKAPVPTKSAFAPYSAKTADALFAEYADADDADVIDPEGLGNMFTAAQISLEGAMPLLLSWQLSEAEMMKLTRECWTRVTAELRISSLATLALMLNELYDLIVLRKPPLPRAATTEHEPYNRARYHTYARDPKTAFGEFYAYLYKLAAPPSSRNIDIDTALTLWSVALAPAYPLVAEFVEFVNEAGSFKAVNKDLWSMMYEFVDTVRPDLSNYGTEEAWPTSIDDFVEWKRAKDGPRGEHAVPADA